MADASEPESVSQPKTKGRIYRKRDTGKESKDKMIKFYQNPENRARLIERIHVYNETADAIKAKVAKLSEYLVAPVLDSPERAETS
jgi:hypothetical protein